MADNQVIIICGPTGAGKSSLAAQLELLGYQTVSCSALVRQLAGISSSTDRHAALSAGQALLRSKGYLWFALKVRASMPQGKVVIDGPRPIAVVEILANICPNSVVVYLDVTTRELRRRRLNRGRLLGGAAISHSPLERRSDRCSLAINYLIVSRPGWSRDASAGIEAKALVKGLVSDRYPKVVRKAN